MLLRIVPQEPHGRKFIPHRSELECCRMWKRWHEQDPQVGELHDPAEGDPLHMGVHFHLESYAVEEGVKESKCMRGRPEPG